MDEELIIIGKTLKTHGLKGALRVAPLTDVPKRFQGLKSVILETRSGIKKSCTLEAVRESASGGKAHIVLACREITSAEEAAPYVQGWVKIPRSQTIPLPKNQFYHFDLMGMAVFFEDGQHLGTLEEILKTGGNDIFVVRHGSREYLIPAIREVVRAVDVQQKRMVLQRISGLIEDDAV